MHGGSPLNIPVEAVLYQEDGGHQNDDEGRQRRCDEKLEESVAPSAAEDPYQLWSTNVEAV